MPKEIIISVSNEQSRIAIVENGELVELYVEDPENVRTIGDIYLARIRRIKPETRAAFVDIGHDQDAFLHFSDLSENVAALIELAEGHVRAPATRELAKEPAAGAELEAETPEEQLAAQRRRDLKRSSGGRRRGQKKDAEAASEASSESPEKETPQKGRRRPAARRTPIATPPAEGVPPAPAIIPPGTAPDEAEPSAKGSPEGTQEKKGEERPDKQQRRSRSRKPSQRSRKQGAAEESTAAAPKPPAGDAKPARTRSSKGKPDERAERPDRRSSAPSGSSSAETAAEKDSPASAPTGTSEPEAENTSVPRLAPSSRFRIDLTGGPGPSRREEEEEEEERSNTRQSSRRQGRSGRGRRGRSRSGNGNRGSNGSQSKQGKGDDAQAGSASGGTPPEKHLRDGQRILVKITKEPISTKGPRVSTDISLAGRFLVLVPAADYVAVSKKIESAKERRRLRALARSLLPEGLGLIVRTVAEGRDAKALDADLQLLLEKWGKIEDQLRKRPQPPVKLYEDVSMVSSIIRDLFTEDYERIVIDDPKLYKSVKSYVQAVAPHMADSVQLHRKKESVFRANKIEKDIRAAFETRVGLPGGGSLIIEHTEAMHVIDVNSGRAGRGLTQEQNALKVNLEAARELAKQLRLRDLGGIICVDFIDMRSNAYRKKLYDELKRTFRKDRAVTKLLPMSDFGVVEITRQRLRPSITTTLDADDIGAVEDVGAAEDALEEPTETQRRARREPPRAASEVVAHLERWLMHYRDEVSEHHRKRPIQVRVHPFLAAYLQRGIPSLLTRWRLRARLKMKLDVDEGVDPLSFTVRDETSGKNLTRKYDPQREDS